MKLDELRTIVNDSEKMLRELDELERSYDGNNGLPKFDSDEVLAEADRNGTRDFESLYKNKHREQLDVTPPLSHESLAYRIHQTLHGNESAARNFRKTSAGYQRRTPGNLAE